MSIRFKKIYPAFGREVGLWKTVPRELVEATGGAKYFTPKALEIPWGELTKQISLIFIIKSILAFSDSMWRFRLPKCVPPFHD